MENMTAPKIAATVFNSDHTPLPFGRFAYVPTEARLTVIPDYCETWKEFAAAYESQITLPLGYYTCERVTDQISKLTDDSGKWWFTDNLGLNMCVEFGAIKKVND